MVPEHMLRWVASAVMSIPYLCVTSAAQSLDPMQDPGIWGGDAAPYRRALDSIVPDEWLVVPAGEPEAREFLSRWILDPSVPIPKACDERKDFDARRGTWLRRSGADAGQTACAFTTIRSKLHEIRMARLSGADWMIVNGAPVLGDPERRGYCGVPVELQQGTNTLFVAAHGETFQLEVWEPATQLVVENFDVHWPGEMPDPDDIGYPVFNISHATAQAIHVHFGHPSSWTVGYKPELSEWRDGQGPIAPLSVQILGHPYWTTFGRIQPGALSTFLPLSIGCQGQLADRLFICDPPDASVSLGNNAKTVRRHPPAELADPIASFPTDAVHVYGTAGSREETEVHAACVRFEQLLSWYHRDRIPPIVADADWSGLQPVVLHGNADSNSAWSHVVSASAPIEVHRGRVKIGTIELDGDDLAGWYTLRHGQVLLRFDTGLRGARLSALLSTLGGFSTTEQALFRVDSHSPSGFVRVDVPSSR